MNQPIRIALVSLVAALAPTVTAQADATPTQLDQVTPLIGRWEGTGELTAGGATFPLQVTYVCEVGSAGFGVKCHCQISGIPEMASYEFDDLWGFSAGDGLYHWYTVTNAGETHDHRGSFRDGHAALQFDGPQDGMLLSERVTVDLVPGKKLSMAWDVTVGGQAREAGKLAMTPARR